MTAAEELLQSLNLRLMEALGERDQRVARVRAYWDSKPRTLLNGNLERIEIDKCYAQFTLETADIRAERERIIDTLAQAEMHKPVVFTVPN